MMVFILAGCVPARNTADNPDFTAFTEELFRNEANSDSLTLNYTLSHPENYGITNLPGGFHAFSYEDLKASGLSLENLLASMEETYDRDSLSLKQQILYDILCDTLQSDKPESRHSFLYYWQNSGLVIKQIWNNTSPFSPLYQSIFIPFWRWSRKKRNLAPSPAAPVLSISSASAGNSCRLADSLYSLQLLIRRSWDFLFFPKMKKEVTSPAITTASGNTSYPPTRIS